MNTQATDLIDAYAEWISTYQWDCFLTLTFREPTSKFKALATFRRWIDIVRDSYGAPDFRYFCVLQFGAGGENIHFHVLLGGLNNPEDFLPAAKRWGQMAGWAEPTRFHPDDKAFTYILRFLRPDSDPDIIDFSGITGDRDAIE